MVTYVYVNATQLQMSHVMSMSNFLHVILNCKNEDNVQIFNINHQDYFSPVANVLFNLDMKSECSDFRQCRNPTASQFGFQHVQISEIQDFWDTHKTFGIQRVRILGSV